ncbi:MAG TPA: dihydrodipicolinate synthase family protein [bacterium]|nr:dihydrodipicolinate synthase family protein [bacterium]
MENEVKKQQDRFHGIVPPIVTPLSSPDRLDSAGLRRLIRHVVDNGVHGVFALGSTGEFPSLSSKVKKEIIEVTVEEVNGKVPVYIGVGDPDFSQVVKNAAVAAGAGADVAVILAPFYYPLGDDELVIYFNRLAEEIELPIILYNIPTLTKVKLSPEVIARLSRNERIIGLKDSQGDMSYMKSLLNYFRDRQDFRIFVGVEMLIAESVLFHGHGAIPGGANVAPALFVELYEAALNRDFKTIDRLQYSVMKLADIYRHGRFWSSYLKGLKTALSIMGICDDTMTAPFDPFHREARDAIEGELKEIGII